MNDAGANGPGDRVFVDFPLVGAKGSWAVVLSDGWRPVPQESAPQSVGDTAVLELEDKSLLIEPVPLRSHESYRGLPFSSYGFPESHPESDSAHGRLDLRVGLEWLRVEPDSNALIEPGFSGAPVWDHDARSVVAMIVTRKLGDGRVAYALPMNIMAGTSTIVAGALQRRSKPLSWLDRVPSSIATDILRFNDYVTERTKDFQGREFVFAAMEKRMADPQFSAGYILIRGEPGIGKTAILAQLAQTRGYPHHFNIRSDNIRSQEQFLRNACAQLMARYELPVAAVDGSKTLESILRLAVDRARETGDGPVVLLVDALDEGEEPAPGVNRLSLPHLLPSGAYVIASIRKNIEVRIDTEQRAEDILLERDSLENQADVKDYIQKFLSRHRSAMNDRLREWGKSQETFVDIVSHQSEGNFMYLRHALPDIRDRKITKDSLSRLERLPKGLSNYYSSHWSTMRDRDRELFRRLQRPILCVLAKAREAVSAEVIAQWINESHYFSPVEVLEVEDVLGEWAQFIQFEPGSPPRFRLYHQSFLDFLEQEVGLKRYLEATAAAMHGRVNWELP